jgi:hypothetical protein
LPLPWRGVNSRDSQSVAVEIGLPKAEKSERRKWGCPFCGSSDALHAYPGEGAGFSCWSACGAGEPKLCRRYSVIDVASQHWRISPADACRRLAGLLGIAYLDSGTSTPSLAVPEAPRPRPPAAREPNDPRAALRTIEGATEPELIYAELLNRLTLTSGGRAYLAGRRLDAERAREYGYRSLDPAGWQRLARFLLSAYRPEELAAAGFPVAPDAQLGIVLPFNGRLPALLIPYHHRGRVVGMRFRNTLRDDPRYKHNRYRNLKSVKPPWPYNADALRGRTVHICEGELNAETLRQLGQDAPGKYGAGIWLEPWTDELQHAEEIVDWHDSTDRLHAGDIGAASLRQHLTVKFGSDWVARRWKRMLSPLDPNALHQAGRLEAILQSTPWRSAAHAEVRVA